MKRSGRVDATVVLAAQASAYDAAVSDRRGASRALQPFGSLVERRIAAIVGRLISEKLAFSGLDRTPQQLDALNEPLARIEQRLDALAAQVSDLRQTATLSVETAHRAVAATHDAHARLNAELRRAFDVLQLIYDEEPANRRRLWRLRASSNYARAFSERAPLVSVVIPTYNNYRALAERSLPSALAQTYPNLEVVVVGDDAPAETGEVIEQLNDGRIRFHNLERRGPYSDDLHKLWLVGGTPPYNTAVHLARGLWIAYLSDDDSFRRDHLERLVARAQAEQLELCYGLLVQHERDGSEIEVGAFPPAPGQFGFQAAIYHAGLSEFFEFELADAEFGQAVDWGLCRRMLRAGVRMGFVPEPTADYYPSWDWNGRKERHADAQSQSDGEV
jgi:Glycosyl transferase family 2